MTSIARPEPDLLPGPPVPAHPGLADHPIVVVTVSQTQLRVGFGDAGADGGGGAEVEGCPGYWGTARR